MDPDEYDEERLKEKKIPILYDLVSPLRLLTLNEDS